MQHAASSSWPRVAAAVRSGAAHPSPALLPSPARVASAASSAAPMLAAAGGGDGGRALCTSSLSLSPSAGASVSVPASASASALGAGLASDGPAVPGKLAPRPVLVKVGDGQYTEILPQWSKVAGMTRGALLRALKDDELFSHKLKGVALDECSIFIVKRALPAGKRVPDAWDETKPNLLELELEGLDSVGQLVQQGGLSGSGPLFILVRLPPPPRRTHAERSGLVECPRDGIFAKLARGIASVPYVPGDKVVVLPNGASWPYLWSNVLYVRHFYKDLWESVLESCTLREDDHEGAIVIGTPGIGKTAFALYALFRALKAGRTVIYHSAKCGFAVFKDSKAFEFHETRWGDSPRGLDDLRDPKTLYISEGRYPERNVGAFTLVVTSPKKENWTAFRESPSVNRLALLPMFSEAEILELREAAFKHKPGCSLEEVKERFIKWGGNVRNVLTKAGSQSWQQALEWTPRFSVSDFKDVVQRSCTLYDASTSSDMHVLLNLVPHGARPGSKLAPSDPEYYAYSHAELPSVYTATILGDYMRRYHDSALCHYLHTGAKYRVAAGCRDMLYERAVVVPLLQHGAGKLHLQRLSKPWSHAAASPALAGHATLDLSAGLAAVQFTDAAELKAQWAATRGDALFVPRSKQQEPVDLVMRLQGHPLLVKTTMSPTQDIKADSAAFLAVLDAVGLGEPASAGAGSGSAAVLPREIPLLWLLPEDAYEESTKPGDLKSGAGSTLIPGPAAVSHVARRLAQYKLELPIPGAPAPWSPPPLPLLPG